MAPGSPIQHRIRVIAESGHFALDPWYIPICSCGWEGDASLFRHDAEGRGVWHLRETGERTA